MNISRAFTFAFDDRDGLVKLLVTALVTVGAIVLTPLLVGLALLAALLAYQAEISRRVRLGLPRPLPGWTNFVGRMQSGAGILTGMVVYNIPNALLGCCVALVLPSLNQTFTGTTVALGLACCVFPLLIAYNAVIWPMLALAVARYTDRREVGVFFEFGPLLETARRQSDATIQFLLASILANVVLLLFAVIPCAGWVMAPALLVPVHGYLMGEYAARALGRPPGDPRPVRSPAHLRRR
ncbi:MAG: DUF4013 domain-containing protein [Chloroflexota bacterium]